MKYSENEINYLKENYFILDTKLIAEKLNRNIRSIQDKAFELGLKKEVIKQTKICLVCNKEFTQTKNERPSYFKRKKYCSRKCSHIGRRNGKTIKCEQCGKETYKHKTHLNNYQHNFCSLKCANIFQGRNKVELVCKICGKSYRISKSYADNNYKNNYCSLKCRNNDPGFKQRLIDLNKIQQNKKGLNKLEKTGNLILDKLDIKYENQVLLFNKFLVDVYIKELKVVIQWDGDYWHGHFTKLKNNIPDKRQEKRMKLDISQDAYLNKCKIKVLRFWENEVYKNKEYVIENIKRTISEITE